MDPASDAFEMIIYRLLLCHSRPVGSHVRMSSDEFEMQAITIEDHRLTNNNRHFCQQCVINVNKIKNCEGRKRNLQGCLGIECSLRFSVMFVLSQAPGSEDLW